MKVVGHETLQPDLAFVRVSGLIEYELLQALLPYTYAAILSSFDAIGIALFMGDATIAALRPKSENDLPACGRRNGKHHCAMSVTERSEGAKHAAFAAASNF